MPRRSVAQRRGGGPALSMNELRLGEPSLLRSGERLRNGISTRSRLRSLWLESFANPATTSTLETRRESSLRSRHFACLGRHMPCEKRYVYVLESEDAHPHCYVGLTSDVAGRIADHNGGRCPPTAHRRPWHLHVTIAFEDQERAIRFERYLKSGSGRAFAKRHFAR